MIADPQWIIRTVNRATEIHYIATGLIGHHQTATGPKVDTTTTPSTPINISLLDLANDIATTLRDLALDIADTLHEWPDNLDPEGAATYIRQHATRIPPDRPGPYDTIDKLDDFNRRGLGVLGMLPRRTRIPELCECGATQYVIHETPVHVRCERGHDSPLTDHAYPDETTTYTYSQAARILGITQSAISQAVKKGRLDATPGAPGKPGTITATALKEYRAHT